MPLTRSLLLISLSAVLITACNSSTSTSDDAGETALKENLVETTGNPCLEPRVIDRMKEHIKERAEELITTKYSVGAIDTSLLYGSDISLDYISQPTALENGDLSCSAKVTVSYLGNADSKDDLAVTYAKLVNANIEYSSNPFANAYSGYDIKQELASIGVNEFNIGEFSDIVGSRFSTQMEYEIRKTYSESGEEQQSYQAAIGRPAAMLATIALLDNFIQKNKKSDNVSGADSTEGQAAKADSYFDDEYVEDVDDFQDDPAVINSQKRQAPESEDQKVNDRDTAQTVINTDKAKIESDIPKDDLDNEKYDTSYVYGYDGDNVE